jgi:hypothetical protein
MSIIDEIEKETHWMCSMQVEKRTYSKAEAARSLRYKAKSVERIEALVEYVKAAEALIKVWGPLDLPGMSNELQTARAKLELIK